METSVSTLGLGTVVSRTDRQVSCRVDEEAVVMSLERHEFYSLNPTASAIWQLTEVPQQLEHIVDEMVDRYEVDRATCAAEVRAVLERMSRSGIIDAGGQA